MGLLDQFFGTPEQTQALGLLGAGMMAGRAPAGFEAALGLLSPDAQLKRKLMTEELAMKQLAEQRAQQQFKMQQDAYYGTDTPAGSASAPSQPAIPPMPGGALGSGTYGIPVGGQSAAAPQNNIDAQLSRIGRMAIAQVPGAKEQLEILKYRNDPQKIDPGSYSRNSVTGAMVYNADPTKGITLGGDGSVQMMPNADVTLGRLAGATASATEGAKDQFAAPSMVNTPQGPRLMTPAQARAYANGGQSQQRSAPAQAAAPADPFANLPPPQSGMNSNFSGDPSDVIRAIANMTDPQERSNAYALFADQIRKGNGSLPSLPGGALKTPAQDATDAANKAFLEGRAKDANTYESGLNGRVAQGTELNMRLQEQLAALQKFNAGGGGETRAQLAQMAQAMGLPSKVVNGVAGGDIASMQEFNKLAAQTAMEQLKQSMGGAGRISQYEFKVFQNNNPNLSTDPDAIRKIFEFNNKIYRRDLSEQQAFNQHIDAGGNPAAFPAMWAQRLAASGVTQPNMATGAPLPTPMKGMVRNGYRFKGGDPSSPNSWEKQ